MRRWILIILAAAAVVGTIKYVGFSLAEECQNLQNEALARIDRSKQCETDADCTILRLSCPFECETAINRTSHDGVMEAVRSFTRDCMLVCPECPKGLLSKPRCRQGLCSAG